MPDLFNLNPKYKTGFEKRGEDSAIIVGDKHIALAQNYRVNYQVNIQPLYEVGSANVWFSASNPSGTITVNRIVTSELKAAGSIFGTVCTPKNASFTSTECKGGKQTFKCTSTVLQAVEWSGEAQNAYVTEQATIQFVSMEV